MSLQTTYPDLADLAALRVVGWKGTPNPDLAKKRRFHRGVWRKLMRPYRRSWIAPIFLAQGDPALIAYVKERQAYGRQTRARKRKDVA